MVWLCHLKTPAPNNTRGGKGGGEMPPPSTQHRSPSLSLPFPPHTAYLLLRSPQRGTGGSWRSQALRAVALTRPTRRLRQGQIRGEARFLRSHPFGTRPRPCRRVDRVNTREKGEALLAFRGTTLARSRAVKLHSKTPPSPGDARCALPATWQRLLHTHSAGAPHQDADLGDGVR